MKLYSFAIFLVVVTSHSSQASVTSQLLAEQYLISKKEILKNLPDQNGYFGSVAASPTQQYQFHWTRDAALTWQALLRVYQSSNQEKARSDLFRRFEAWVKFEKRAVKNALNAGYTRGEPKFMLNALPFTGDWGRPQNDGPALRSLVMSEWALQLITDGKIEFVKNELYRPEMASTTIIKADLEFTAQKWQEASFDPWEEVKGLNFYGLAMQRKSLLLGATLALQMNDPAAADYYLRTAQKMLSELKFFSDSQRGYVIATRNQVDGWTHKSSQLDAAIVLATVQGPLDFAYISTEIKALQKTVEELEKSFRQIYKINLNRQTPIIGRYPEDVYDGFGFSGGNPWFLTTHAYAEYYCKLAKPSGRMHSLNLNKGREYLIRVLEHRHQQTGEMSEQMSRENGYLTGVSHLTWSYASFITAMHACFPEKF